jgi:hypothetical protein
MPKFSVPVVIEINGSIDVEAETPEEAIELAKEEYDRRCNNKMKSMSFGALACNVIDCPDILVDFAHGDDVGEVEEDEG